MTEPARGKLISIVIPVYNEEENVEPAYSAVREVFEGALAGRYDWELLFTDNHSTDRTFSLLAGLAARDRRVRVLRFSKNFGFQKSIWTGYVNARGDAAIQLDCDLQDPPALIPRFLALWEEGHQVVYGIRRARPETPAMRAVRKAFYRLIDYLSEEPLPLDAGDFRLVDRRILDIVRQIEDQQPYLRGTIAGLGFRQIGVPYDRNRRERGASKFGFPQLVSLGLDGILNHSIVPLRLATITGLVVSVVTALGSLGYLVGRIFFERDWPAGFATTTILILFSLSLNALFLGIIGEYLGRIYQQIKRRPVTLIETRIDPE